MCKSKILCNHKHYKPEFEKLSLLVKFKRNSEGKKKVKSKRLDNVHLVWSKDLLSSGQNVKERPYNRQTIGINRSRK